MIRFNLLPLLILTSCAPVQPASSAEPPAPRVSDAACAEFVAAACATPTDPSSCAEVREFAELLPRGACAAALPDVESFRTKLGARRAACEKLAGDLCAAVGEETPSCEMVREQTATFTVAQCREMYAVKGEIIADLQAREGQGKPLSPQQQVLNAAPDAPSLGPADAPMTLVIFSDIQCPYCAQAEAILPALRAKYEKTLRVVFRHFPLSFHEHARGAATASVAAHNQGKFWEYTALLFKNQSALAPADLERHAAELKLDMTRFRADLALPASAAAVDADIALANQSGVRGTPSVFLNGVALANPVDFDAVSADIDAALAAQ